MIHKPKSKTIRILGTRGVPAAHGGFETFAEYLSVYLNKHNWNVTVYCQEDNKGAIYEDSWQGIRRVHIPVSKSGPLGTIIFDWKSTLHAISEKGLVLTLGYNTAIFCFLYRLKGITNLINMDGIEWKRAKWSKPVRVWFWVNEILATRLGSHLIADNPGIEDHLAKIISRSKITMIPYGAEKPPIDSNVSVLNQYGLASGQYATVVARPEPENSILEIVSAWSKSTRNMKLVVLGKYDSKNSYHQKVMNSASKEVVFIGAIYDKNILCGLRRNCAFYIHGHQVGGTNPSLLEALSSENPVLAFDNIFNRWVAGNSACYFSNEDECSAMLDQLISNNDLLKELKINSLNRYFERFTWDKVLQEYDDLLTHYN